MSDVKYMISSSCCLVIDLKPFVSIASAAAIADVSITSTEFSSFNKVGTWLSCWLKEFDHQLKFGHVHDQIWV